jgi:hypothetical protein
MPTEAGKAFVLQRLFDAPDQEALRRVWESLGVAYQKDPDIRALKDQLKANMK